MSAQHPLGEPSELMAEQLDQAARGNDGLMLAAARTIREERQKRAEAEERIQRAVEILTAFGEYRRVINHSTVLSALSEALKELTQ